MAKRQTKLPGIAEDRSIKELDAAAESYVDARDKRIRLSKKEDEAKTALIAAMKKHEVTVYKDYGASPPLIVTVTPGKEGVKVVALDDSLDADDEPVDDNE